MKKVEISDKVLIWPDKCAYCSDVASGKIKSRSRAVQKIGYFWFFLLVTSRIIEIEFPVCQSHKLKAWIASKLSQRNALNLTLGVLSTFALLGPVGDIYRLINGVPQPDVDLGWRLFMYGFPTVYWALFFWAKSNSPVVIEDLKGKVSFYFRNEAYGGEFELLNTVRDSSNTTDAKFMRID